MFAPLCTEDVLNIHSREIKALVGYNVEVCRVWVMCSNTGKISFRTSNSVIIPINKSKIWLVAYRKCSSRTLLKRLFSTSARAVHLISILANLSNLNNNRQLNKITILLSKKKHNNLQSKQCKAKATSTILAKVSHSENKVRRARVLRNEGA